MITTIIRMCLALIFDFVAYIIGAVPFEQTSPYVVRLDLFLIMVAALTVCSVIRLFWRLFD